MPSTWYWDDKDKRDSDKLAFLILIALLVISLFSAIFFPQKSKNKQNEKQIMIKDSNSSKKHILKDS